MSRCCCRAFGSSSGASGIDDTSNFDQYAESVIDVDEPLPDPAEALQAFKDF